MSHRRDDGSIQVTPGNVRIGGLHVGPDGVRIDSAQGQSSLAAYSPPPVPPPIPGAMPVPPRFAIASPLVIATPHPFSDVRLGLALLPQALVVGLGAFGALVLTGSALLWALTSSAVLGGVGITLGTVTAASAALIFRRLRRGHAASLATKRELGVLRALAAGPAAITDLAVRLSEPLDRLEPVLEKLARQGHVVVETSRDGAWVGYRLPTADKDTPALSGDSLAREIDAAAARNIGGDR